MKAEPCKRCGCIPEVVCISDLYYCQCHGFYNKKVTKRDPKTKEITEVITVRTKCDKWGPYEFLGATEKAAISAWNDFNTKRIIDMED